MRRFKGILYALALVLLVTNCQEEEPELGAIPVPSNLQVNTVISDDGTGIVEFSAEAENSITYAYIFDGGSPEVAPNGTLTKRFNKTGLNTYSVGVVAYGQGGTSSSTVFEIEVQSNFENPEVVQFLTSGSSKTWYLDAAEPAHLGVGPAREGIDGDWWWPKWFAAQPFEKCGSEDSDCLCDDELTFALDANGQLTFELDNKGQTFFNVEHAAVAGGSEGVDFCYDFDTTGVGLVAIGPASGSLPEEETRNIQLNFSDNAFMGYYVGSSSYEILAITATTLYVRTIDALDADLAWYHKFTTVKPDEGGGTIPDAVDVVYSNLFWSDEFDVDGAPDTSAWAYDEGANGWGNNELQYYTNRAENISVSEGILKITAKREDYLGAQYTSTRIKTQGRVEFTYGRVDVRAKLPEGGGTWPAIWMLGANIPTVGWPACGELDIMEHVGNNQGTVHSSIHTTASSGNTVNTKSKEVLDVSSEFHVYSINWSPDEISFLIDDEIFYTYNPSTKDDANWPFNKDQFLILNIAMGGNFGGAIDPSFIESSMEVDYIRVYQ